MRHNEDNKMMNGKKHIHMRLMAEKPDHVRAWEVLQSRDRNRYPTMTEFFVDVINNHVKESGGAGQKVPDAMSDDDRQRWTNDLLDEMEKRFRAILRGPVGR